VHHVAFGWVTLQGLDHDVLLGAVTFSSMMWL
jgi:hypothetical protein